MATLASRFTDRRIDAETWHELAAPQYPPLPEGYTPKPHPFTGKPLDWALKLIWGLAPGGADQPGVVWCGTMPGGLFKSEDNGESWELNRPLWDHPKREDWGPNGAEWPGIHSICVDPRDSRHVSVGVSTGGVWITRDGGNSWDPMGRGMRADYFPEEQQYDPNVQDVHCLFSAPPIRRCSGCSITTASSDLLMAPRRGPRSKT